MSENSFFIHVLPGASTAITGIVEADITAKQVITDVTVQKLSYSITNGVTEVSVDPDGVSVEIGKSPIDVTKDNC